MPVTLNKKVADFKASSTGGEFKLSKREKSRLVIFFYSKDNTPGCSNEAADFRDHCPSFAKADCEIVGVSRDSLKSHESFRTKLDLPFSLISDPEEVLCMQFEVMKMKNMYGKQVRGIDRSTFVIDAAGKLVQEWRGVKVPGHVAQVLEFVQSL